MNEMLEVADTIETCVIAGTRQSVTDQLVALVDRLGSFGTLLAVGHDWDETTLFQDSMTSLAEDVMPVVSRHAATLRG